MCPLYDFGCDACETTVEELCKADEQVLCPDCQKPMNKLLSLPTSEVSPKYRYMYQKMQSMRNKITGKTPFRKHSESQTE